MREDYGKKYLGILNMLVNVTMIMLFFVTLIFEVEAWENFILCLDHLVLGKQLFLRIIAGFDQASSGEILF